MTRGRPWVGLLLALVPATIAVPAAQAQEWAADAYAGRAVYDAISANVGTSNGVLGIRYRGANGGRFYLSAAAPLSADDPLWGAAGVGRRWVRDRGRYTAGIGLAADVFGFRDPLSSGTGAGGTFQALPFIRARSGSATLEFASGLIAYQSAFAGETVSRTLFDSQARLAVRRGSRVELAGEARYLRNEEIGYPYLAASASMDLGGGEIWASTGRWFAESLDDFAWAAGGSVDLGPRFQLWGSYRQEAADPVYASDARRSWNIGVTRRLGTVEPRPAMMTPPEISPGHVTIRLPVTETDEAPFVLGDFTGWKPVAMVRSGDFWAANLPVEAGYYHYGFRTADGEWFVPESIQGRREDGFGGFVAVLVVP